MNKVILFFSFFILTRLLNASFLEKDSSKSIVLKNYNGRGNIATILNYRTSSYRLAENFYLLKESNAGNAYAKHELGLRHLTGSGFLPDTNKAAYYIKSAAEQELALAKYNLGILQMNGWGIEWNPFEAFDNFLFAAERNMPQAQYIIGMLYTDNLIIPQNLKAAFLWVKKSADGGFAPSSDALMEFKKRGIWFDYDSLGAFKDLSVINDIFIPNNNETISEESVDYAFINFDKKNPEAFFEEETLLSELDKKKKEIIKTIHFEKNAIDSLADIIDIIKSAAFSGSPEALTLLGKIYEKSDEPESLLTAAVFYIRGARLGSQKALESLWKLNSRKNFNSYLKREFSARNINARFVLASLALFGFEYQLSAQQAVEILVKNGEKNHVESLFELGYLYFSGIGTEKDQSKGVEVWSKAAVLGDVESKLRLGFFSASLGANGIDGDSCFNAALFYSSKGSITAQTLLGYCYEQGIGVQKNYAKAESFYRLSAQRGGVTAFNALKKLYDLVRPREDRFYIE